MKVSDLMERLGWCDPDMEVHIAYNFGDYWRTIVSPKITKFEESVVKYSGYHNMDALVDDDQDGEPGTKVVVILR